MPLPGLTHWYGFVLDAPDPQALGRFYRDLLGWTIRTDRPDWVTLSPPTANGTYLGIHVNAAYEPPVWPSRVGSQQHQAHLDVGVADLDAAVAAALALGAREAADQPQDDVRVMFDPVGHTFCLYSDTAEPDPA